MIEPRTRPDLARFFDPRGVALIGAIDRSTDEHALRAANDERWGAGNWHLVNPTTDPVGSIPVYGSIADVDASIDLAVIAVAAHRCADVVRECGAAGVGFAVVFSSGFAEIGAAGAALEAELAQAGIESGVRLLGPNTNTNAFERFADPGPHHGRRIAVVTQSGHNGRPIVQGVDLGLRFDRLVPTGNEVDIDVCDVMHHLAEDPDVGVIAAYVEGFKDGERLQHALRASIESSTPIVLVKIGATGLGARSARTHTGHLVGSDAIAQALFDRHGVTRVRDLDELLETAALFAKLRPSTGPRVALYSISGGSGALMAELAELHGVPLAAFSIETVERLAGRLPAHLDVTNPVDNGGTFLMNHSAAARRQILVDMLADPAVDVVVVAITGAVAPMTDLMVADLIAVAQESDKPIIATWNSPRTDDDGYRALVSSGVPLFRSFRGCFGALAAFERHRRAVAHWRHRPSPVSTVPAPADAQDLLRAADIDVVDERIVPVGAEVAPAIEGLPGPLALKIHAAELDHKSDVGLVRVDVDPDDAAAVCADLLRAAAAIPGLAVEGVAVQPMVRGVEMIVGVTSDPVLGRAVVVGTGGVHTEVLSDRVLRPVPIDREDARAMVRELRGHSLLHGHRGAPPADVDALIEVVVAVGMIADWLGDQLVELDLNPVIVAEHGAVVVDSLVVRAD